MDSRWWFKYFLFSPLFGEDSQFDQCFSTGLKPPTRIYQYCLSTCFSAPFFSTSSLEIAPLPRVTDFKKRTCWLSIWRHGRYHLMIFIVDMETWDWNPLWWHLFRSVYNFMQGKDPSISIRNPTFPTGGGYSKLKIFKTWQIFGILIPLALAPWKIWWRIAPVPHGKLPSL